MVGVRVQRFTRAGSVMRSLWYRLATIVDRETLQRFARLIGLALIAWTFHSLLLYAVEPPGANNDFRTVGDYFWQVIVSLFSGLGYTPTTFFGRVIAGSTLVFAAVFIALFTAEVVGLILELARRRGLVPFKPTGVRFHRHIVVCNWNPSSQVALKHLHSHAFSDERPIVIVDPQADQLAITSVAGSNGVKDAVWTVAGEPTSRSILQSADVDTAAAVILAADRQLAADNELGTLDRGALDEPAGAAGMNSSDSACMLSALAVRKVSPSTHICIELLEEHNRCHFEHFEGVDVVSREQVSARLLAQAALQPGLTTVYRALLSSDRGTPEPYFIEIPDRLIGRTFHQIIKAAINHHVVPIGLRSAAGSLVVNPAHATVLEAGDQIVLIGSNEARVRRSMAHMASEGAVG